MSNIHRKPNVARSYGGGPARPLDHTAPMPDSDTDASWAVELRRAFRRYDADVSRLIEGAYMRQEPSVSITCALTPVHHRVRWHEADLVNGFDQDAARAAQRTANVQAQARGRGKCSAGRTSKRRKQLVDGLRTCSRGGPAAALQGVEGEGRRRHSAQARLPLPRLLPPPTLQVEVLHASPGENVILIRKALAAASQLVVAQLLTTAAQHLEQVRASGKGAIWVDESGAATTLLHGETRMALRASAVQLRGSGNAAAADEVAALADEREYTSTGGALVYETGERLGLHLDDIVACIWSFGNDVDFRWAPARFKGRPMLDGSRHNATYEI